MKKKIYQIPRTQMIVLNRPKLLEGSSVGVNPGQSGSQTGAEAPAYHYDEDDDEWGEEPDTRRNRNPW